MRQGKYGVISKGKTKQNKNKNEMAARTVPHSSLSLDFTAAPKFQTGFKHSRGPSAPRATSNETASTQNKPKLLYKMKPSVSDWFPGDRTPGVKPQPEQEFVVPALIADGNRPRLIGGRRFYNNQQH